MVWLKDLWSKLIAPYKEYKEKKEFKKLREEMRKKDPFLYK